MPLLLIISGPPASGKTTLARRLAADLAIPLFTKDGFKEPMFDRLGWRDRAWSQQLGLAALDMLEYAARSCLEAGQPVAIEANFDASVFAPRFRELQAAVAFLPVEIRCLARGDVLVERYRARGDSGERHPGHVDRESLPVIEPVLRRGELEPLGLDGPRIDVDTTDFENVEYDGLVGQIRMQSRRPPGTVRETPRGPGSKVLTDGVG